MDPLFIDKYIEAQLFNVASSAGIPLDQLKFVFCCLVAYPLAFVFSMIPCKNQPLRHIIGMVIGMWFAWFTIKWQILHSFITSTIAYFIVKFMDRKVSHKIVFAFAMIYMSVSHIYRMYTDYMGWSMDFTGPQMILTIKLITFAFDYHDGSLPTETLSSYQQSMCLTKLPSLLEYYGYVYFFGGFLAGPAFNLKEYLAFIDGSLFKSAPGGKMPSSVVPTLLKFGQTLLIGVGVVLNMQYPLSFARTDDFTATPLWFRCWYIWVGAFLQRFPYYFAWNLSEGSCIMAGIGFTKYENGKSVWDRATNVRILPLEFGQSLRDVTENWNIRTDKWLKHYIYARVKSNGVALTFLTSAVWHGFYPGYYISFMTAAAMTVVARNIRRVIRPRFMEDDEKTPKPTKKFYDFATWLTTSWTLNYCMTPFILLGGTYSYKALSSVYFIGHILVVVGHVLTMVVRPPKRKATTETKKTH